MFYSFRKKLKISKNIELKERLVTVERVCKVTKGRRYFSFSALVIKGNENGIVGYGLGKSNEISDAIHKAGEQATKNLVKISIYKGTIPHEQSAKFGGSKIFIRPASEGTGIIAGGAMRYVLEIAGIYNVLSKSKGSSNPHNVVKATIKALINIRNVNIIAKERGISINKVFNG
ncbi:MAG: 30S ribosomal protein S5 [Candidatus Bostrichicola ureolyticus]|nr:MAG: 30S ribosomal protein S5 [Candidatus Bostrichicola ureolyticus]